MSSVTHTAFIFSATGSQGSALCQQLRDLDWNVRATTRNLESPGARKLRNRGVQFTQSDWEDMDALRNSMSGCEKLYLCLHPKLDDLDYERRQAEKIIKVAKEVGIKQVVASTSLGVSMLGTGIHITPNSFMAKHLAGKKGVEQAVIDANFEHWMFLRPAFFMANFLEPKVHRYPELRDKGTWTTAMTAEGKFALIDHVDIAKVATAAFQDPEKFHGRAIGLASELLTIPEILDRLGDVIQRPLEAVFMTEEEVAKQKDSNVFVNSQIAMRYMSEYVDMEELSRLVPLTTFKQFLAREEDIVKRTYL
ncbi:hypothetical protein BTUL_0137g00150 [Botrytis tulipae]|uniref:NmrA-like domain-containing protein n=1 Tax=Botrytis tulipae TaxID=87230 RepID=A0A4Z1EII0_9HELO|nr:hypothetical protein BTUL_0137g00150 [Botrytis tulipae]